MSELINNWDEKENVWTVNKTTGKGDDRKEIARMTVSGAPDEKTALHWAVDEGIITKSDLAVALRTKMTEGNIEMTWEKIQELLTTKVERKIDPDTRAIANAITTGNFESLTKEQAKKAANALKAFAG